MLGLAIALADDDVSDNEREIASQLATVSGLGGVDLDGLIAQIRS